MKSVSSTKWFYGLLAGVLAAFLSTGALAEESGDFEHRDFSNMEPSGTVEFEIRSLKLLAGVTWGGGVLHYQGKEYPLDIAAVTVGGVGYKSMTGKANVYDLKSLEDFPGTYGGGAVGATVGNVGGAKVTLENAKGVVMMVTATDSAGAQVSSSLGGLEVSFD